MNDVYKRAIVSILCIILSFALVACPPRMPCDEKITHPEIIEDEVLSNPVLQQIETELTQLEVNIAPCFVNNRASVVIQFELPASFSDLQLLYRGSLSLAYSKDGTIGVDGYPTKPAAFEREAILDYFRENIQEVESNPRVREVVLKTSPDELNHSVYLPSPTIYRSGNNQIEYNFFSGLVRGYTLSNDIDWQEFPEIKQAHQAISDHLLIGEYSTCSIGHGEHHGYTAANFHDSPTGPWFLTVAVICDSDWKDAFVRINSDGTYDRLEFRYEPNY